LFPRRKRVALLLAVSLAYLGSGCNGERTGTVVNLANSYGEAHQDALTTLFGCGDAVGFNSKGRVIDDNPPIFVARQPTMLDMLASWRPQIVEMAGPVTVVLHAGNGEEAVSAGNGLTPDMIAANAKTLIEALLAIRPDLTVHLMTGVGLCKATFHTLLGISDPRFEVPDLSRLDAAFERPAPNPLMADSCHPSELGAEARVEELLRVSPTAAAQTCR
jgi:hypothetical protein